MVSADNSKAGDRAALAAFLTLGIASLVAAATSEGATSVLWIIVGGAAIAFVLAGIHKRIMAFFSRIGGSVFVGFLAIFLPLAAILLFLIYGIGLGLAFAAGIPLGAEFVFLLVLALVLVLGNLSVLVANSVLFLRNRDTS